MASDGKTVRLNVGGTKYEVARSTIEHYPDTMLARLISDTWQQQNVGNEDEIFIDRDGHRFRFVLDFMRDKEVALPMNVSKESLLKDLEYFGFDGVDQNVITCRAANAEALKHMRMCFKNDKEKIVGLRRIADLTEIALQCVTKYLENPSSSIITVELTSEQQQLLYIRLGSHVNLDPHAKDVFNKCLAEYGLCYYSTHNGVVQVKLLDS